MNLLEVSVVEKAVLMIAALVVLAGSAVEGGEKFLGPWRKGDFAYSPQLADYLPNSESRRIVKKYFRPIVAERVFRGQLRKLAFRVAPRNESWAGILITTPDGAPVSRKGRRLRIEILDAGRSRKGKALSNKFLLYDTRFYYSDASKVFRPLTEIAVWEKGKILDTVTIDFRAWKLQESAVKMHDLVPGPTRKFGFVRPKQGDFVRDDGKQMFFWGGHENHIPTKERAEAYAEAYKHAGINVMRHLGMSEMISDAATCEVSAEMLDRYHYLIAKLGEQGIYFFMGHTYGYGFKNGVYGYKKGEAPNLDRYLFIFTDPKVVAAQKRFWKKLLTTVNPYNGLAIKDDPTVIGFELANETGLNPRYFDYNPVGSPSAERWRELFNKFLVDKYKDRTGLAEAWRVDQVFRWEDPKKQTVMIPTRFRGQRTYGGTGQHDQVTTGRYYLDGAKRICNPRISDAIEFTYQVQRKWASEWFRFLRQECGMKCALGWNGDGFHICQVPNHKANMDAGGSVTIAAGYCDWDNGNQLTSRTKNLKRWIGYSYIYDRPTFAYEWGGWSIMGPYQHEYILQAAVLGATYGFDGFANHKMSAIMYPVSDPVYSVKVHYITPISDPLRRGAFCVARWILERSKLPQERDKIIIGYPSGSAFSGGPDRKMSSPAFENWINYQLPTEDYSFEQVYDGPTDRVVIHEGRGPYGDYSKAKHAVLWCHSNSDRYGKDEKAKEKWFAKHGIHFKPGQKYFLNDKYFATTLDMTEYVVVHEKAEKARWADLKRSAQSKRFGKVTYAEGDYWSAEPDAAPTELDRQLYRAFKKWGYNLPFSEDEIDKVWRNSDRTVTMDTRQLSFVADRNDMQLWFGKLDGKGKISLSKVQVESKEKQYAIAVLPWDTADFKTAKSVAVWTPWNSRIKLNLAFNKKPKIYAVNWLGVRIFEVEPESFDDKSVTFQAARHEDIFCYEVDRS